MTTASFSADGRRLITVAQTHFASADDKVPQTGNVFDAPDMTPSAVRVWDTDTGELAGPPLTGRGGRMTDLMDLAENDRDQPIFAAAISPDGQRMLVSTVNGLRLHDVATGQPVGEPWITETPRAIGRRRVQPRWHTSCLPTRGHRNCSCGTSKPAGRSATR